MVLTRFGSAACRRCRLTRAPTWHRTRTSTAKVFASVFAWGTVVASSPVRSRDASPCPPGSPAGRKVNSSSSTSKPGTDGHLVAICSPSWHPPARPGFFVARCAMQKILEAIRRKEIGDMSYNQIGEQLQLSPSTVSRYWGIYQERGYKLYDLIQLTYEDLDKLFNKKHRCLVQKRLPDLAHIHRMMKRKHQTLERLWEDYCLADPSSAYGYSSFTRLYRDFAVKLDLVMRQTHLAGECVFVDFAGTTVPWTDMGTGERHRAQVFVAVMGCS